MTERGTIYGVGLGPGGVDLMSVRADRLVRSAKHIAFFRKAGRPGHARTLAAPLLADHVSEFAMEYPVTTEIPLTDPRYNHHLSEFYEACCAHITALVDAGEDVVVLCEGDPFFYGSFMHIYNRVKDSHHVEVVPAITGMSAAWTATGAPITWGDDVSDKIYQRSARRFKMPAIMTRPIWLNMRQWIIKASPCYQIIRMNVRPISRLSSFTDKADGHERVCDDCWSWAWQ